jgi:hypothetical protein
MLILQLWTASALAFAYFLLLSSAVALIAAALALAVL